MAAAVTIAALFAFSIVIVRFAAVAMRLTGVPDNIARFQCVSALTGAGFTTGESELIVNYPIRRRIVVILMVLGNLGLVSTSATLIVSFVGIEDSWSTIITHVLLLVAAITVSLIVMLNRTTDRLMCGLMSLFLRKTTSLAEHHAHKLLQLGSNSSVMEHLVRNGAGVMLSGLPPPFHEMTLLGIRRRGVFDPGPIDRDRELADGDILVCYGSDTQQTAFQNADW